MDLDPVRQLAMDYREFKRNLAEEIWPEVGDSFNNNCISANSHHLSVHACMLVSSV